MASYYHCDAKGCTNTDRYGVGWMRVTGIDNDESYDVCPVHAGAVKSTLGLL